DDANTAVDREGAAPVGPMFRFLGKIPDDLFAGQVCAGGGQAKIADELHTGRVVGLAGEPYGARANGLGLPFAGPELVALRDEVFRADVESSRAGWRFRSAGRAPLFLLGVEVERVPALERILQNAPADLVAQRHPGV